MGSLIGQLLGMSVRMVAKADRTEFEQVGDDREYEAHGTPFNGPFDEGFEIGHLVVSDL